MSGIILLLKHSLSLNPYYKQFFPNCAENFQYFPSLPESECSTEPNPKPYKQWAIVQQTWAQCVIFVTSTIFGVVAPQANRLKAFSHSDLVLSPFYPILWYIPSSASLSVHFPIYLITDCIAVWLSLPLLCKGACRAKSGLDTCMDEIERKKKSIFQTW